VILSAQELGQIFREGRHPPRNEGHYFEAVGGKQEPTEGHREAAEKDRTGEIEASGQVDPMFSIGAFRVPLHGAGEIFPSPLIA
jgi:hypothetical protein